MLKEASVAADVVRREIIISLRWDEHRQVQARMSPEYAKLVGKLLVDAATTLGRD